MQGRMVGVQLRYHDGAWHSARPPQHPPGLPDRLHQSGSWQMASHELWHPAARLSEGVSLQVVSDVLGHSSIRMTADVYGHFLQPQREDAASAWPECPSGGSCFQSVLVAELARQSRARLASRRLSVAQGRSAPILGGARRDAPSSQCPSSRPGTVLPAARARPSPAGVVHLVGGAPNVGAPRPTAMADELMAHEGVDGAR